MMSDEHLLLKDAAGGDASALEALMSRYGSRVYRLAHGITRNSADAEEIVQDVFLQMVRKGGAFEGSAALGSWIYRVTTNVALNKRRGKRREVETSLEECLPAWEAGGCRPRSRPPSSATWPVVSRAGPTSPRIGKRGRWVRKPPAWRSPTR